jgi:lysozyme
VSDLLRRLLQRDEGRKLDPYRDSLGLWTIGYGHLIDRRKGGRLPDWLKSFPISQEEAEHLLDTDVVEKEIELSQSWPAFESQSALIKAVMVSMAFQMGVGGVMAFTRTLQAIEEQRWADAGRGMRESLWARQTPKRATRLALAVETGDAKFLELG